MYFFHPGKSSYIFGGLIFKTNIEKRLNKIYCQTRGPLEMT